MNGKKRCKPINTGVDRQYLEMKVYTLSGDFLLRGVKRRWRLWVPRRGGITALALR